MSCDFICFQVTYVSSFHGGPGRTALISMVPGAALMDFQTETMLFAAMRGHDYCIEKLVQSGVNVNTGPEILSPLTIAVKFNNTDCVNVLLRAGADVNAADADGYTLLITAVCEYTDTRCTEVLLEAGAEVNSGDITPLLFAIKGNKKNLSRC